MRLRYRVTFRAPRRPPLTHGGVIDSQAALALLGLLLGREAPGLEAPTAGLAETAETAETAPAGARR